MTEEITNERIFEFMTEVLGEVKGIKEEMKETNKRLTSLDEKSDRHFKALYDGYAQNTEQLKRIEVKVDTIEKKVIDNEVQIRVIQGGKEEIY